MWCWLWVLSFVGLRLFGVLMVGCLRRVGRLKTCWFVLNCEVVVGLIMIDGGTFMGFDFVRLIVVGLLDMVLCALCDAVL